MEPKPKIKQKHIVAIIIAIISALAIIFTALINNKNNNAEKTPIKEPISAEAPPDNSVQAVHPDNNVPIIEKLQGLNISLADYPEQQPQVLDWLNNTYSGYPALANALVRIMRDHRLKGTAVPLTIINAHNLREHDLEVSRPITDENSIKDDKLKQALLKSWKEKNSGLTDVNSFEDMLEQ